MRDLIQEVKDTTSGLQDVEVYCRYYECAKESRDGHIFDVGTGQGGSTISFALGLKENPARRDRLVYALDQFYQHKRTGPHPYSMSEYPSDCVQMNVNAFEQHLKRLGVESLVRTVPGKVESLPPCVPKDVPIGILCLDTDGYIDRDFDIFFDNVVLGGTIIVDDYSDTINHTGRKNLDEVRGKSASEILSFVERMSGKLNGGGRLLGKHLLTYRLTQYFMGSGAIELVGTTKSTAFARKRTQRPLSQMVDFSEFDRIRLDIQNQFIRLALNDKEHARS